MVRFSLLGIVGSTLLFLGCGRNTPLPDEDRAVKASTTSPDSSPLLKDAARPMARDALPAPQGVTMILRIPSEMVFRRVSPKRYGIERTDFFLLETEVTNAMYADYLAATGRAKGDEQTVQQMKELANRTVFSTADPVYQIRDRSLLWSGNRPPAKKEEYPVTLLTVNDGAAFCAWLTAQNPARGTFRYPTVEEWLVAAYGADRKYPWGDEWDDNRVCCSVGREERTSGEPVRARPEGRTPEGIYGMWGNASEYVIHAAQEHNALFMGVGARWMGGSFADSSFKPSMKYWGYTHSSEGKNDDMGFRVLLDMTDKEHRFKHQVPYDRETR